MGGVTPRLIVSVSGLGPGAPLTAAVALADALDARRVPATLAGRPAAPPRGRGLGHRPAPGGRRGAAARHADRGRVPDVPTAGCPRTRPGLRLAAALRSRDALGLAVDGFAAPGWSTSAGTRSALAAAGVGLVLDDAGRAPPRPPAARRPPRGAAPWPARGPGAPRRGRPARRRAGARPRPPRAARRHARGDRGRARRRRPRRAAPRRWPRASSSRRRAPRRTGAAGDPEDWSITA